MNSKIESKVAIVVPPALVPMLDHLVTEYALENKEEPGACRRAIEIAVLQRGVASMRADAEAQANKAFAERMGWPKGEETE